MYINKKKGVLCMKKKIISSLVGLTLVLSFVLTVSAYSQRFDCSYSGISCKGVEFKAYGTAVDFSEYVYAQKGQKLAVNNESTGQFNFITQLVDSNNNNIGDPVYFTDTQYRTVPSSGNYRVKVYCSDTSVQERCTGRGSVSQ